MTETSNITEVGAIDQVAWGEHYEEGSGGKVLPPDGKYILTFPEMITDANFKDVSYPADGEKPEVNFLAVTLDFTIASGLFEGEKVRYLRFDTRRHMEFKEGADGKWAPTGKLFNSSDAADLLLLMKSEARPTTLAEYREAITALAGMTTPKGVKLVWKGYDKVRKGSSSAYLKSKDFVKLADGSRPPYIVRVNEATGEEYKAFANLALNIRGFFSR